MIVYRICQTYPPDHNPMDGQGAFTYGGRWNTPGVYAVYTAGSLALARAEIARHFNLESVPDGFQVYKIEIPDRDYPLISPLPKDWADDPIELASQQRGNSYLQKNNYLAFRVPSVCDPQGFNYVLNPLHEDYRQVKVVDRYAFVK